MGAGQFFGLMKFTALPRNESESSMTSPMNPESGTRKDVWGSVWYLSCKDIHDFFVQMLRRDPEGPEPSPYERLDTAIRVDDDPGIRELYAAMLGTYEYEVLVAEGGHQALDLFRSKVKEIDAVISDYEMPRMNGAQLAAELKSYDPDIPVIVISGSLPILEQTPYFVDAAVPKGASVEKIIDNIEALLEARRAGHASAGLSRKMPPD